MAKGEKKRNVIRVKTIPRLSEKELSEGYKKWVNDSLFDIYSSFEFDTLEDFIITTETHFKKLSQGFQIRDIKIYLYFLKRYTQDEIAYVFDLEQPAVSKIIKKILKKIK